MTKKTCILRGGIRPWTVPLSPLPCRPEPGKKDKKKKNTFLSWSSWDCTRGEEAGKVSTEKRGEYARESKSSRFWIVFSSEFQIKGFALSCFNLQISSTACTEAAKGTSRAEFFHIVVSCNLGCTEWNLGRFSRPT